MKYNELSARNIESAKYYGFDLQSNLLMEECAELIQAVNKYKRKIYSGLSVYSTLDNLIEEIADVELMLEQIKALLNISDKYIEAWKKDKVERTRNRIAKERCGNLEIDGTETKNIKPGTIEPLPGE